MKHYNYQTKLHELWSKAVESYAKGERGAASFFSADETDWLLENGITTQEIYDFAEDYNNGGEPDFATFAMVTDVRRNFFLHELGGKHTTDKVDPDTYPPKTEEIDGIVWLPRIIQKAKAKLHGRLDEDTMYGCGGDRKFLRENDIHPAEFLTVVREHLDDDQAVISFVKARRA
ncbi:MAG: DUF5069 domain-containing protein [Opitutales bacterium]